MGLKIIQKISEYKDFYNKFLKDKKIGFVPTMGALHEGHLSLLEKAKSENEVVVLSIFVNPIQFGKNEDLDKYPRPFEKDIFLAEKYGADIVFYPSVEEMYPKEQFMFVNPDGYLFNEKLCSKTRPGHFKGVATVVMKLFNIVQPNFAYFGQKDYQQVLLLKYMIEQLNMNLELKMCPIVREDDGLAKSSRNQYLTEKEREDALCLHKALEKGLSILNGKENLKPKDLEFARKKMIDLIKETKSAKIDYVFVGDAKTLEEIKDIPENLEVLLALAVYIGNTRLIDNEILVF
jgi:pantoate--beta-alanine ligase